MDLMSYIHTYATFRMYITRFSYIFLHFKMLKTISLPVSHAMNTYYLIFWYFFHLRFLEGKKFVFEYLIYNPVFGI